MTYSYENGQYNVDNQTFDNYMEAKEYIDNNYGFSDMEEIPVPTSIH